MKCSATGAAMGSYFKRSRLQDGIASGSGLKLQDSIKDVDCRFSGSQLPNQNPDI